MTRLRDAAMVRQLAGALELAWPGSAVVIRNALVLEGRRRLRSAQESAGVERRLLEQQVEDLRGLIVAFTDATVAHDPIEAGEAPAELPAVELVGTVEAAELLGCDPRHVSRIAGLDPVNDGRPKLYDRAVVEELAARRRAS